MKSQFPLSFQHDIKVSFYKQEYNLLTYLYIQLPFQAVHEYAIVECNTLSLLQIGLICTSCYGDFQIGL